MLSFQVLEKKIFSSIRARIPDGSSILLGYSGGPDSEALLQLFLATGLTHCYMLHLVHVDHGWRVESKEEAKILQQKAAALQIPFHLFELDPLKAVGNLENWARNARGEIFQSVGKTVGSSWLLLGHQKDDSIEVTLKRFLEGAHLIHAAGIAEKTTLGSMNVLRPLVEVSKDELVSYLRAKRASWLYDATNENVCFLRASMRSVLFPILSKHFKKDVRVSLKHVAKEAFLLQEHIQDSLEKNFFWKKSPRSILCRPLYSHVSRFLLMQALHSAAGDFGAWLSRQQEEEAVNVLSGYSRSRGVLFSTAQLALYVDTHGFMLLHTKPLKNPLKELCITQEGSYVFGSFRIVVSKNKALEGGDIFAPEGFSFSIQEPLLRVVPATEKNIRQKGLIPSPLRNKTPVFFQNSKVLALPYCMKIFKQGGPYSVTVEWIWSE